MLNLKNISLFSNFSDHCESYAIGFSTEFPIRITVEATQFDDKHIPIKWGIRNGLSCRFSKKQKTFILEPKLSEKTEQFIEDCSFDSAFEAAEFFKQCIGEEKINNK